MRDVLVNLLIILGIIFVVGAVIAWIVATVGLVRRLMNKRHD